MSKCSNKNWCSVIKNRLLKCNLGARMMPQWWRCLPSKPEDMGSVPWDPYGRKKDPTPITSLLTSTDAAHMPLPT